MLKMLCFCENCRGAVKNARELHFVEENSDRGFCCEKCIMEFYKPYMLAIEQEEVLFRQELDLSEEESFIELTTSKHHLDTALHNPSEVWILDNELEQEFYTHILKLKRDGVDLFFILICSYIEGKPCFVYYRTATKSRELLVKYQRNTPVEKKDITQKEEKFENEEMNIPADVIEFLENKKSSILADLLGCRSASDISFEEFMNYDTYLEKTLETPDEMYEFEDDQGDILHHFIKSFKKEDEIFFYIVVVFPYNIPSLEESVILPIIGFPSRDQGVYLLYCKGKNLNEKLKN